MIPGGRRKRELGWRCRPGECGAWWRAICLCVRPGRVLEVGGGGPGRQREFEEGLGKNYYTPLLLAKLGGTGEGEEKKTQLLRSSGLLLRIGK